MKDGVISRKIPGINIFVSRQAISSDWAFDSIPFPEPGAREHGRNGKWP